jgi:Subtilase family
VRGGSRLVAGVVVAQATVALFLLVVTSAATGAVGSPAGGAGGAAASKVPTLIRKQVGEIREALRGRASQELSAQQLDRMSGGFLGVQADGGIDVQLHAVGSVRAEQLQQLADLGVDVRASSADFKTVPGVAFPEVGLVDAIVPYDKVDAVAALPWVAAVRPTIAPALDVGPITAEGVPLHHADVAQAAGFTGAGQKIGVISDDVDSLAYAVAQGELPDNVQVVQQAPYDGDEGTAMLEIIHDMAPGAALAFNTVGDSLTTYVEAFHNLADVGATLITEDIALDDEPAFQQGIGATTAEELARGGIWVSSSAGNLGARHAPRVSAVGTGRGPDGATGPFVNCPSDPTNTVNLRGTDNTYNLNLLPGAAFLLTLQWSEPRAIYPTVGQGGFTNLDLYVVDAAGTTCLAYSNAVQANGVGDTIEQLIYQNQTGVAQPVRLVVNVAGTSSAVGTPLLDMRWRALTAGVQTLDPPDRAGSLNPDSNYLGFATSAGAVNASVSVDPATIPLEPFSAAGPVQIGVTTRCAGGAAGPCTGRPGAAFRTFGAPNWAAADGVSVSGAGGFGSGTCPTTVQGQCRFFGTSASAPGAAGVAALVREQNGGTVAPRQLNSLMAALAFPRGSGFGAGVLLAIQ